MAEESVAEEFVVALAEVQGAMADVYTGIDEGEITADEAADLINELTDALELLFNCERDEATQAEIEALVTASNDDFVKIEEGVLTMLKALKSADYLDSAKLKAACERYAECMDLAL